MDNIFLFPPSDEEIEALVSMSPEEVDAQLIELGLDPDAPLPERIKNLIDAQEEQGGTLHYINSEAEKFRPETNGPKKQRRQSVFQSLKYWAAAALISICLGLVGSSADIRLSFANDELKPTASAKKPSSPRPEKADNKCMEKLQSSNISPIKE